MGYSVPRKLECHSACGLRPRGILSLLGTLYPREHSRSLSNPYLDFPFKNNIETVDTFKCKEDPRSY